MEFPPSDTMFSPFSGIIDNAGGKILVQKVAGHSGYRGTFSNGIRSLSLPRWRESFIVSGTMVEHQRHLPSSAAPHCPASQAAMGGGGSSLLILKTCLVTTGPPHLALASIMHMIIFILGLIHSLQRDITPLVVCSILIPLWEVTGSLD